MKKITIIGVLLIFIVAFLSSNKPLDSAPAYNGTISPNQPHYTQEALYTLINAELLINNDNYGQALQNYLGLAAKYPNAALGKRATALAMKINDMNSAVTASKYWAEADKQDPMAQYIATILAINTSTPTEARPFLDNIFVFKMDKSISLINKIYKDLAASDAKQALLMNLRFMAQQNPTNVTILYVAADIAHKQGHDDVASGYLKQAMQIAPNDLNIINLHARLLFALNQKEAAINYFQAKMQRNPGDNNLKYSYAVFLKDIGKYAESKQQFVSLENNNQYRPEVFVNLGEIAIKQGDLSLAKQKLLQAADFPAVQDHAQFLLADIANMQHHYGEAVAWYTGIKGGTYYIDAQLKAAVILAEKGDTDAAVMLLNAIVPDSPNAAKWLGITKAKVLLILGQTSKALIVIDNSLSSLPGDVDLLLLHSTVAAKNGDYQQAEQDLKVILKQNPNNIQALIKLSFVLLKQNNRNAEALSYAEKALITNPNDPSALDGVGWVQYHMGNYKASLEYLMKAKQISADPRIASHLGEVLWVSGQKKAALVVWEDALKLAPDNKELLETMTEFNNSSGTSKGR